MRRGGAPPLFAATRCPPRRGYCGLFPFFSVLTNAKRQFSPYIGWQTVRLRRTYGLSGIEYIGLNQKEFAAKIGIKRRTLDTYLRAQQSMPPADTAVKIAAALGLSVEYLVTGKEYKHNIDISGYLRFRDILDDLAVLPDEILESVKAMIRTAADSERRKKAG